MKYTIFIFLAVSVGLAANASNPAGPFSSKYNCALKVGDSTTSIEDADVPGAGTANLGAVVADVGIMEGYGLSIEIREGGKYLTFVQGLNIQQKGYPVVAGVVDANGQPISVNCDLR